MNIFPIKYFTIKTKKKKKISKKIQRAKNKNEMKLCENAIVLLHYILFQSVSYCL